MADPDQAPRRPRYLSFVLLVGWLIGLRTLHDGYVTLRVLGDPLVGDTLRLPSSVRQAVVESTLAHSEVTSPLAAAQVVAGVFLLVACAGTLFGLFKRISWGVQALLVNLGVAVAAFAWGRPVREALVSSLARAPELIERFGADAAAVDVEQAFAWGVRLSFFAHLLGLMGILWGLSRRSAREFVAFSPSRPRES